MKKTIFISSTYTDLIEHRKAVWELLEKYDTNIKGMEAFGARKEAPIDTCLNEVSQSDIYVGIIAQRLGSIEKKSGKPFTQLEYERAIKEDKEILIYLINEKDALVSIEHVDFEDNRQKLENFKTILKDKHTIDSFKDKDDLTLKLEIRLDEILKIETKSATSKDIFEHSKDVLSKFHLLPKTYSENEIRLTIEFNGKAYPASKDLCRTFGYTYARTIGVPIKIIAPQLEDNELNELFMEEELADLYFKSADKQVHEIVAKLLFSSDRIVTSRANFFDKSVTIYKENPNFDPTRPASDMYSPNTMYLSATMYNPPYIMETKQVEGEGKAILMLKEIIISTNKKTNKQRTITKAKKS